MYWIIIKKSSYTSSLNSSALDVDINKANKTKLQLSLHKYREEILARVVQGNIAEVNVHLYGAYKRLLGEKWGLIGSRLIEKIEDDLVYEEYLELAKGNEEEILNTIFFESQYNPALVMCTIRDFLSSDRDLMVDLVEKVFFKDGEGDLEKYLSLKSGLIKPKYLGLLLEKFGILKVK